eukprot:5405025-Prymnesium_polylepis.1
MARAHGWGRDHTVVVPGCGHGPPMGMEVHGPWTWTRVVATSRRYSFSTRCTRLGARSAHEPMGHVAKPHVRARFRLITRSVAVGTTLS